jgi:K+/H+ antiporter YhaU regulatory subunit KhtT
VGHSPLELQIRDDSGCAIVAVERAGEIIMDFPASFVLAATDAIYVCGTVDAVSEFHEEFAEAV